MNQNSKCKKLNIERTRRKEKRHIFNLAWKGPLKYYANLKAIKKRLINLIP